MDDAVSPSSTGKKIWTAGTLTYTSAGIVMLFLWLLWGDFAWAMRDRALPSMTALMLKSFDVSDFAYGLITVSFTNFTNLFLGPIISYQSDRHRGRFGRRIPYIFFTTPFVMAGLIGIGFSPVLGEWLRNAVGEDGISRNSSCLIVFCVFWVVLDFGMTLAASLFGALVNDVVPRKLMGRFMALFRMVSLGCAIIFNSVFLKQAESYMAPILIGLGLLYGFGMFSICLKVKEGEYPPLPPEQPRESFVENAWRSVKRYFRESFRLPFYRWVMAGFIVGGLSVAPINIFAMFYAKSLGMELALFGNITSIFCTVSLVLSFFLGWLSDKFHPIRTGFFSLAILMVVLFVGGQVATSVKMFAFIYLIENITIMSFNTLMASYTQRLFPQSHYAQLCSATGLVNAFAMMVLAPVLGKFLDLTGNHYPHVFTIGGVFAAAGLVCLYRVYRCYLALGGDQDFRAPEPDSSSKSSQPVGQSNRQ